MTEEPTTPAGDRLQRALEHLASTTTVSPDGWERIVDRLAGRRGVHRSARPMVAIAMIVIALLSLAAIPDREREESPTSLMSLSGRTNLGAHYAPRGPTTPYRLLSSEVPSIRPTPPQSLVAYGRRAPDGVTLDDIVVVTTRVPVENPAQRKDSTARRRVSVGERQIDVYTTQTGVRFIWDELGLSVAVSTVGLSEEAALAFVAGVTVEGVSTRATELPESMVEIHRELAGGIAGNVTVERWGRDRKAAPEFTLTVTEGGARSSLDAVVWTHPTAELSSVGDHVALYDREARWLAWSPRPRVLLVLSAGPSLGAGTLESFARSVAPLDEAEWLQLRRTGEPPR